MRSSGRYGFDALHGGVVHLLERGFLGGVPSLPRGTEYLLQRFRILTLAHRRQFGFEIERRLCLRRRLSATLGLRRFVADSAALVAIVIVLIQAGNRRQRIAARVRHSAAKSLRI